MEKKLQEQLIESLYKISETISIEGEYMGHNIEQFVCAKELDPLKSNSIINCFNIISTIRSTIDGAEDLLIQLSNISQKEKK